MMDDRAVGLIEDRGKNYGHPLKHFRCTREMMNVWEEGVASGDEDSWDGLSPDQARAVFHGAYMILDKLARASENPAHMDNWDDIQGYAECVKMILGKV
jgi:hypothetical protein